MTTAPASPANDVSGQALGLLGGTFDPVHFGHLRSAVECATAFGLSQVRLMPCNPVHRDAPLASAVDRKAMLELAVQGSPLLAVESYELEQEHSTYTIDTLRHIRQQTGYGLPLYFIVGSDAFNAIETWKEWQALFAETSFIVMHRPACPLVITHPFIRARLADFAGEHVAAGRVYPLAISGLDISSTRVRQLIRQGQSIEFLLPEAVENYIQQKRLYQ